MRKTEPMSKQEFDNLFRVRDYNEMTDDEIESYTSLFMDRIRELYNNNIRSGIFWCPKCECNQAALEIDEGAGRTLATCPECRMAVVVISANIR